MSSRYLHGLVIALLLALAAPTAQAVHPLVILEDSYELLPSDTRWPDSASGAVTLPGCTRCRQSSYSLGEGARFLVGQTEVEYREFLATVRSPRATGVFIAIERSTGTVSRATVMP